MRIANTEFFKINIENCSGKLTKFKNQIIPEVKVADQSLRPSHPTIRTAIGCGFAQNRREILTWEWSGGGG